MAYLVRFASNAADLDAGYAVRREVFEREQNIPRPLDRDPFDVNADHVVALDGDRCVGTGRAVRLDSRTCQIGRMAVAASHRRKGVGASVLLALERMAKMRGVSEVIVHTQLAAEPFFRKRGYAAEGPAFLEQGVPHVLVRKGLFG
jgi:predicted GNAT family N-acyltransferase